MTYKRPRNYFKYEHTPFKKKVGRRWHIKIYDKRLLYLTKKQISHFNDIFTSTLLAIIPIGPAMAAIPNPPPQISHDPIISNTIKIEPVKLLVLSLPKQQLPAKLVYIPPKPKPKPVVAQKSPPAVVAVVSSGCGDNSYANYIYMHESTCNTSAVNSLGCRGIGQACPGSKLPCGADYACQNKYFTDYALTRYGSWASAYSFWVAHSWW